MLGNEKAEDKYRYFRASILPAVLRLLRRNMVYYGRMNLSDITLFHGSAAEFVKPTFDVDILEKLLMLGGLGIQYCLKTERAFASVRAVDGYPIPVEYGGFNAKYNERDRLARDRMDELIAGPRNPAVKVMSTLV